jgi:hypothetical protein
MDEPKPDFYTWTPLSDEEAHFQIESIQADLLEVLVRSEWAKRDNSSELLADFYTRMAEIHRKARESSELF